MFGILKKRWKVLEHGFKLRSMAICKKINFTCCCLQNKMLDMMELQTTRYRILRGLANQTDGMWLSDGYYDLQILMEAENNVETIHKHALAISWAKQHRRLAEHLYYSRRKTST